MQMTEEQIEKFGKPHTGYYGYTVTRDGKVYSWNRMLVNGEPALLQGHLNSSKGGLWYGLEGKQVTGHNLVVEVWLGWDIVNEYKFNNKYPKHLDLDVRNNSLDNAFMTHQEYAEYKREYVNRRIMR